MVSNEKATEILLSTLTIGKERTADLYNLAPDTIDRYLRLSGNPATSNFAELASMYSSDELKALTSKKKTASSGSSIVTFDSEEIRFLALTDTHIGSKYTNEAYIKSAINEGISRKCQFMIHSGDVTEGMSGRDGHVYELSHIGYKEQRKASIELFSHWTEKFYAISGNHDLWYASKNDNGGIIVEDICQGLPNGEYLGEHEGSIFINGVEIRLWHGEDTGSYATSYRLQKLVESFSGGEKPAVLLCGHTHKSGYIFERNCHIVTLGSIQKQSAWMRRKRLAAHCGFYIITMGIKDREVTYFEPRFYPFYK